MKTIGENTWCKGKPEPLIEVRRNFKVIEEVIRKRRVKWNHRAEYGENKTEGKKEN